MLLIILLTVTDEESTCGIPILMWLLVHISLFMANSVLKVGQICVMRYYERHRVFYNIGSLLLINFLMTAWLIYGNFIFFSDKNDCGAIEGTHGLYGLMFFFILIGYF